MSTTTTLAKALVAAQAEMPAVPRDGTNPHFKNRYATLDGLLAKVRPVLNKHGLAVAQFPSQSDDGSPTLVTLLLHESGERIEYEAPLLLTKQDAQGQGSAITYMRRYALAAMLGISDQDDDDGNATRPKASAPATSQASAGVSPPSRQANAAGAEEPSGELAPPKQVSDFWKLVDKVREVANDGHDTAWWRQIADKAAVRQHGRPVARLTDLELGTVAMEFQTHLAKLKQASAGAAEPGNGSPDPTEAAGAPAEQSLFKPPAAPRGSKRKEAV
jgi:hypothetical protein